MNAIPVNPLASAWRARSTMSATGTRTCGRNKYHSAITHHPFGSLEMRRRRRLTCVALVYYFYYVRGLMDVGLNSGQLALRDSVRDVLRTECPPAVARQAMTDPERWRTVWKTVVDLGWTELARARRRQLLRPDGSRRGPGGVRCGAGAGPVTVQRRPGRRSAAYRRPRSCRRSGRYRLRVSWPRWPLHPPGHRLPGVADDAGERAGAGPRGRGARPPPRRADRHAGVVGRRAGRRRGPRRRRRHRARQPSAPIPLNRSPTSTSTPSRSLLPPWTWNRHWRRRCSPRPPTWSVSPPPRWPARSTTRRHGSSSASRSAHSRASSTRWPTTMWRWSAPAV